jgi:ssDNA-binding Zn-finger/Zn-ribbon topoisomerase 1
MIKAQTWMIGPLLSLVGIIIQHKRKSVYSWMKERRIDKHRKKVEVCEFCGSKLKSMNTYKGPRTMMKAQTCSRYPDCRYVKWG